MFLSVAKNIVASRMQTLLLNHVYHFGHGETEHHKVKDIVVSQTRTLFGKHISVTSLATEETEETICPH